MDPLTRLQVSHTLATRMKAVSAPTGIMLAVGPEPPHVRRRLRDGRLPAHALASMPLTLTSLAPLFLAYALPSTPLGADVLHRHAVVLLVARHAHHRLRLRPVPLHQRKASPVAVLQLGRGLSAVEATVSLVITR